MHMQFIGENRKFRNIAIQQQSDTSKILAYDSYKQQVSY